MRWPVLAAAILLSCGSLPQLSPEATAVQRIMDPIWTAELQLQTATTVEEQGRATVALNDAIEKADLRGAPPEFLEAFFAYRDAYRSERDRSTLIELGKIIAAGVMAYGGNPLGIIGYIMEADERSSRLTSLRRALDDSAARFGVQRQEQDR